MSGNTIHGAVKPENYLERVKAIRGYGKHPIMLNYNVIGGKIIHHPI
jgi:hypothetical protein